MIQKADKGRATDILLDLARDRMKEQLAVLHILNTKASFLLVGAFFLLIRDGSSLPEAMIFLFRSDQHYGDILCLALLIVMYICLMCCVYLGIKVITTHEYDIPNPAKHKQFADKYEYSTAISEIVENINKSCSKIDKIQNEFAKSIKKAIIFLVLAAAIRIAFMFLLPALA